MYIQKRSIKITNSFKSYYKYRVNLKHNIKVRINVLVILNKFNQLLYTIPFLIIKMGVVELIVVYIFKIKEYRKT